MPGARRIILGSLLLLLAISGCDCEARVRKMVSKSSNDDERVAARTEVVQQSQVREVEPNDGPENATEIVLRKELRAVHGTLSSGQDVDWFSVVSEEEGELFELIVTPLNSSLDVALYLEVPGAAEAAPLLYDVGRAGQAESVPVLSVGSVGSANQGALRFFVAAAGVSGGAGAVDEANGAYKVEFRRRLSGGVVESEPNDFAHLATKLSVPGEIQGFYDRPRDQDIYYVAAEDLRGSAYRLEVSQVAGLVQEVRVFGDSALEEMLLQLTVTSGAPAQIPNFSVPEGAQGLWFVLTAGDGFDRERGYRLKVIEHAPVTGFLLEGEPNDTAERAQVILAGMPVRGYLHDVSDVDRFRLMIEAEVAPEVVPEVVPGGEAVGELEEALFEDPLGVLAVKDVPKHVMQARLLPLGGEHRLGMRWISADGAVPVGVEDLTAGAADEGLAFCNVVVGPGAFDLEVRSAEVRAEGEGAGGVVAGGVVAGRGFDYELRVENIAETPGLEVEPNDSVAVADRLEMGDVRVGYIAHAGDVDVFGFAVTALSGTGGAASGEKPGVPKIVLQADGTPGFEPGFGDDVEPGFGADRGLEKVVEEDVLQKVTVHLGANPLNLEFALFDDEGGQVASVNRAGAGAEEGLSIELPVGVYYVVVKAERGFGCEPYRLSVRRD